MMLVVKEGTIPPLPGRLTYKTTKIKKFLTNEEKYGIIYKKSRGREQNPLSSVVAEWNGE